MNKAAFFFVMFIIDIKSTSSIFQECIALKTNFLHN